jgi:hypothetical protein
MKVVFTRKQIVTNILYLIHLELWQRLVHFLIVEIIQSDYYFAKKRRNRRTRN